MQQWPFLRDAVSDCCWHKFPANGKDSIFLMIMALSWWAPAVQLPDKIVFFEEAVTDLHWVIQELVRIRTINQTSLSPLPPAQDEPDSHQWPIPHRCGPNTSSPASSPHSHVSSAHPPVSTLRVPSQCGEGKRIVKLSWKVLANC